MIRSNLINIKNRIKYLAGHPSPVIGYAQDGAMRWNNDKNTTEEYDGLWEKWIDLNEDYAGFPVP